jgi:alanine racemase
MSSRARLGPILLLALAACGPGPAAPAHVVPLRGSMPGNDPVLVAWPGAPPRGVTCRFGAAPAVRARHDARTGMHLCLTPPHPRPEAVPLTVRVGRRPVWRGAYQYTTPGKQDLPLLTVDVAAIAARARALRASLPARTRLLVVLKKTEPIAELGRALAATGVVDQLAVATLHDGIALRRAGVRLPILVLFHVPASQALLLAQLALQPAAVSEAWVREADAALRPSRARLGVHLWIDTGLGREGVAPGDALPLARAIARSARLDLVGLATHLCCARASDREALARGDTAAPTVAQRQRFDAAVAAIRGAGLGQQARLHAGASDVVRHRLAPLYYDLVRVCCLFFENPAGTPRTYTWTARVFLVKTLPAGWCLDYGCERRTSRATRVAVIGHVPSAEVTYVLRGQAVPVLLHSDHVVSLDVTDVPGVTEQDPVTLILGDRRGILQSQAPIPVAIPPARRAGTPR